jgi:hypothetical protein
MSNFITNKQDGVSTLGADEWNQIAEINNLITSSGQSLDVNLTDQIAKGVANYTNSGNFYTENGVANSYTLIGTGSFKTPTAYINGMVIRFITANANTTTTPIVNLAGLGAKNIKKADGTAVVAGDISGYVELRYNGTDFLINKEKVYFDKLIQLINDTVSPNDTISFLGGTFITVTNKQIYLPAITKKIQSSGVWTAGSGANGLDTGARAANTFYRTYVVQNNSTLAYDIVFSTSYLSPTIPSGYTNLGLLDYALIRTNNSNNIAFAKWDANNKKVVLGSDESILVFSSTAGSGNATIVSSTEPLEFGIQMYLSTASAGGSDLYCYGSEQSASNQFDGVVIATNNGYQTAGSGSIYTSDGKLYWKNFSTVGGVLNQLCRIKTIKIRS